MTSLDGKNQLSMEHLHLPKPGNSKPSISIMLIKSAPILLPQLEDVDLSLIRLACLAERALTLSLTSWPEIS